MAKLFDWLHHAHTSNIDVFASRRHAKKSTKNDDQSEQISIDDIELFIGLSRIVHFLHADSIC